MYTVEGPAAAGRASVMLPIDRSETTVGGWFGWHVHLNTHQLVWCPRGTVTAIVGDRSWTLVPTVALWVPVGAGHAVGTDRAAAIEFLYFCDAHVAGAPTAPVIMAISAFTRSLLEHLDSLQPGTLEHRHAVDVLLDQLKPVRAPTLEVRLPDDERARRVADALVADPTDARTLEAWGRVVGASVRTLSRIFVRETGMSFIEWRREVRLRRSLDFLAEDLTLAAVARRTGYADPSSFVEAFRRRTGRTPRDFARSAGREG